MNKEVHKEHLDQLESLEFQGGWSTWVDFGCYMYVYITYIYRDVCVCVSLSIDNYWTIGLLVGWFIGFDHPPAKTWNIPVLLNRIMD